MRLRPPSLWLLLAAQIEAQTQLPTAVRKMAPDAGEKFYHEYCAFADESPDAARHHLGPRGALTLAASANASIPLPFQPPFAPHDDGSLRQGRILGGQAEADGGARSWQLFKRGAAGALARLEGRQWACPGGTSSCADIGYPNSCCADGEKCMQIEDTGLGPVGCCPSGSTCGGSISTCASDNTACASNIGGGCCIPGYVCQGVGCVPSAPVLTTITTTSTSVISAPTPSTVIVTVIITQSQSQPEVHTSTTTRTVSPTTTTTGNGVSAPVRPTSSSSSSSSTSTTTSSGATNTYCPTGFYACLASAGGGCCQTGRDCKTTSCPPAARPSTIVAGGGVTIVVPASAVPKTTSATCADGWFMCGTGAKEGPTPGCCPSGYGCGTASCLLVTNGATASVAKGLPHGNGAGGRRGAVLGVLVGAVAMVVAALP